MVSTICKRTRRDDIGRKVPCSEVRFDDVAGCLRTSVGGLRRQFVIVIEDSNISSRCIPSPRNNPGSRLQLPGDVQMLQGFNDCFRCTPDEINYVRFDMVNRDADAVRMTHVVGDGEKQWKFNLTTIRPSWL